MEKYELGLDDVDEGEIYLKDDWKIGGVFYEEGVMDFKLGKGELGKEYVDGGMDYVK